MEEVIEIMRKKKEPCGIFLLAGRVDVLNVSLSSVLG